MGDTPVHSVTLPKCPQPESRAKSRSAPLYRQPASQEGTLCFSCLEEKLRIILHDMQKSYGIPISISINGISLRIQAHLFIHIIILSTCAYAPQGPICRIFTEPFSEEFMKSETVHIWSSQKKWEPLTWSGQMVPMLKYILVYLKNSVDFCIIHLIVFHKTFHFKRFWQFFLLLLNLMSFHFPSSYVWIYVTA